MAEYSTIEWTDATWNPVTGCSVVDAGCTHCYAMALAGGRLRHHPSRAGLTRVSGRRPKWTGEVRLNEQWLDQPLRWSRPRMIFVCAHGDLFHEAVPDDWIDRVFAVMALCPQHTFQVLTKRPARAREMLRAVRRPGLPERVLSHIDALAPDEATAMAAIRRPTTCLPNVWLGTSVSDQASADARIPDLLATPAAIRFVSAEPLLGPVDFTMIPTGGRIGDHIICGNALRDPPDMQAGERIDWVIVGGESGQDARPMHPAWARSIRDQCAAAQVPFFFKQWGAWLPWEPEHGPCWVSQNGRSEDHHILFPVDFDNAPDWDDGLWAVAEGISHSAFQRVGKKAAGRLLDGVEHNGMPEIREVPAL